MDRAKGDRKASAPKDGLGITACIESYEKTIHRLELQVNVLQAECEELLVALKELVAGNEQANLLRKDSPYYDDSYLGKARAAIRKADGE